MASDKILVCSFKIEDYTQRYTDAGQLLKSAFLIGPSNSIKERGEVTFEGSDNKADKPEENSVKATSKQKDSTNQSDNKSAQKENYNYTILNALARMFEADEETSASNASTQTPQSAGNNSNTKSKSKNKFNPGEHLVITVNLPNEGCTKWDLTIDADADIEKVKSALKSKNFNEAYLIASKNKESDGIVPTIVETYLYKDAECNCPFLGHCHFAVDSGDDNSAKESNSITLAIAPIDAKTNETNKDIVYYSVYNVVGDAICGIIGKTIAKAQKLIRNTIDGSTGNSERPSDPSERDSEKEKSNELSKFLHDKFRSPGDHTMYDEFLKIRNFIKKQIDEKRLEYSDTESFNLDNYQVKDTIIFY